MLIACAVGATTFADSVLDAVSAVPFAYSAIFLAIVFCALLPLRLTWLAVPLTAALLSALTFLNNLKIATLSLPITYFDIRIAILEPTALMNALGLNGSVVPTLIVIVFVCAALLIAAFTLAPWNRVRAFAPDMLAVVIIVFVAERSIVRYAQYFHDTLPIRHHQIWQDLWLPESHVSLSDILGVPEYLAFSSIPASESPALEPVLDAGTVTSDQVREVASSFVNVVHDRPLPNVVIMHAESTFDPNRAFKLASRVDLPLWSGINETKALGALHVNMVGGGSWVTDFEVISGVDSRLFGVQGFYTTYYVAPMVRYSFATYAEAKGYRTQAFSSVPGTTYNYRQAFSRYGFSAFTDGPSLGMSADWSTFKDSDFIDAIAHSGAFETGDDTRPFLYYVDTTENHGPHPCTHFVSDRDFVVKFAGTAPFEMNCHLNEYVRRAQSTSNAFVGLVSRLRRLEAATGRPYVVVAYGDHQPWDFTDGAYSVAGGVAVVDGFESFSTFRTAASAHETIFHIAASVPGVIHKALTTAPPATFLPTLLSAFVASSYDDLYFPQNFYLMEHCGSDVADGRCSIYPGVAAELRTKLFDGAPPQ